MGKFHALNKVDLLAALAALASLPTAAATPVDENGQYLDPSRTAPTQPTQLVCILKRVHRYAGNRREAQIWRRKYSASAGTRQPNSPLRQQAFRNLDVVFTPSISSDGEVLMQWSPHLAWATSSPVEAAQVFASQPVAVTHPWTYAQTSFRNRGVLVTLGASCTLE